MRLRLAQLTAVIVSAMLFIQILKHLYSEKSNDHTIIKSNDKREDDINNFKGIHIQEQNDDSKSYIDNATKDLNNINIDDPPKISNNINKQDIIKEDSHNTHDSTKNLQGPNIHLNKNTISDKRKNVLFLMADDLRPQLGAYTGRYFPAPIHPYMHTPNIDKLASRSLLLKRAYCQQALCCPSRTSLLTGRRPDTTKVYSLVTYFRDTAENITTIPQYFKQHGYTSLGIGKVFHSGTCSGMNDPISWSQHPFTPNNLWKRPNISWQAVTKEEEKTRPLEDVLNTQRAIEEIRKFGSQNNDSKPFFLAVGFYRPHTPYIFPEKFLEFYPKTQIRPPANPFAPKNMPVIGWNDYSLLRKFTDIAKYNNEGLPNKPLPLEPTLKVRRAYYACITYIDSLIGEILNELKVQNLHKNTIVSFLGDHGYKIGEHGSWLKSTNFDIDTHAPMMISIPGLTDHGIETEELTEFVDLFPTLVEASGLGKLPQCPKGDPNRLMNACHEGASLMPLITNPKTEWKKEAFFQYRRSPFMGYSMKNDGYRYTEWTKMSDNGNPIWGDTKAVELYNHSSDPQENINCADDESYAEMRAQLSKKLRAGWRKSLPV